MARCEDWPACGHELGCCPDFDESGRQLNMVCTCGAKLPVTSRYSICRGCLDRMAREDGDYPEYDGPEDDDLDDEEDSDDDDGFDRDERDIDYENDNEP